MTTERENKKSNLLEMFDKVKEFVEKEFNATQTEVPQQVIETADETSTPTEETTKKTAEQPSEETVEPSEIKKIAANVMKILSLVQDFTYKDKINKELHEELQSYKAGLREEFIKPILKSIIREYDRSNQQFEFYSQKAGTEIQSEICAKLLKEFNVVSLGLLDILEDYNLAPFKVNENDDFSSREHKILKIIETDDVSKDGRIEKCVKCGFRDTENGKLLRQAEVNIYKINNNK